MSKVIYDMSMSLDGFVAAAGITPDEPLGVDGERLHHWAFPGTDDRSRQLLEENGKGIGAMITGRRTYDASLRWWGADGPTGEHRLPVYVLTHRQSPPPPADGVYTFVTDGVDSAVRQAKAAADGKNVGVSGVEVGRQLLEAGHVDELWIHVVPVLFGGGIRLYEQADGRHIDLDLIEGVPTPNAAHLRFRVRS